MKIFLTCRVPKRQMDFKRPPNQVEAVQDLISNSSRCANLMLLPFRRKYSKHRVQFMMRARVQSSHFANLKRTLQGKTGLPRLSLTQNNPLSNPTLNLIFIQVNNQTPQFPRLLSTLTMQQIGHHRFLVRSTRLTTKWTGCSSPHLRARMPSLSKTSITTNMRRLRLKI